MTFLSRLLVVLIALWLPVQAAAAVAMPGCHHGAAQAAAGHGQHGDGFQHSGQGSHDTGTAGDNGGLCQLANASVLPSMRVSSALSIRTMPAASVAGSFLSFFPEQRDPPPLSALR